MAKSQELRELTAWLTQNSAGHWEYEADYQTDEFRGWLIYFSDKLFFQSCADFDKGHAECVLLLELLKAFNKQANLGG